MVQHHETKACLQIDLVDLPPNLQVQPQRISKTYGQQITTVLMLKCTQHDLRGLTTWA